MPGLSLKQLLPKGLQPGAEAAMGHVQKYWPAYAAGGLGLLALTNAMRRKKRPAQMQKYSQEFAARHPLVASFFVKCAHLKLSEQQIEARIRTMALIDDDIRTRFELAFRDDFFKQAGVLSNMGNNASRFSNGLWGSLGGGLGTIATGIGSVGNHAWNAVTPKSMQIDPAEVAAMDQSFTDSSSLAQAGVSDMGRSLFGEANDYTTSDVNNLFSEVRNRPGVTDATRTASNIAGGISSTAASGAEIFGGPGAIANTVGKLPGVSTAMTAAGKVPGAQTAANVTGRLDELGQANVMSGQGLRTLAAKGAVPAALKGGKELAEYTALSDGGNAVANDLTDRPLMEGSITGAAVNAVRGQPASQQQLNAPVQDGQPPPTSGDMGGANPLPGDALPGSEAATTNPAMAAAPQQSTAVSPGTAAIAAGGQPGAPGQPGAAAPAPAGAAQVPGAAQPQPGGVDDAQLKAVAADPNVPPEAKQQMAGAAVTDAASSAAAAKGITMEQLNKDVAGFMRASETPEQAAAALDNLANATAKENPEAAKAPDFMQNLTKQYTEMDPGSKALMFIGGGLGLLGLANALGGEGGIGDWLLAILGIGTAAGVAGGAGMFGQDAQKMIGGMGSQLMGMLPGGQQKSKLPPLTPSATPNPATAPPAAGQNVNIAKPAGGAPGAMDLSGLQKAHPFLDSYAGSPTGKDPNALDPGDAETVIGDYVRTQMGGMAPLTRSVGPVDEQQMAGLVASLQQQPAMASQVVAGIQAKLQDPETPQEAHPHLQKLLQQLTPQN